MPNQMADRRQLGAPDPLEGVYRTRIAVLLVLSSERAFVAGDLRKTARFARILCNRTAEVRGSIPLSSTSLML